MSAGMPGKGGRLGKLTGGTLPPYILRRARRVISTAESGSWGPPLPVLEAVTRNKRNVNKLIMISSFCTNDFFHRRTTIDKV